MLTGCIVPMLPQLFAEEQIIMELGLEVFSFIL